MNGIFEENYLNEISSNIRSEGEHQMEHRASCHRCGNIRKAVVKCSVCPHVFCKKCADKMVLMDGNKAFVDGCPLCKDLCCCGSKKSHDCNRQFHCYKKCMRSRLSSPKSSSSSPRVVSLASLRRYPSYQSQQSTIDEYTRADSDSEDENPAASPQGAQTPFVGTGNYSAFSSMADEPVPSSELMDQATQCLTRIPFPLTPIDTSVGFDYAQEDYERSKAKASRSAHGETPTKKMRMSEFRYPQQHRIQNGVLSEADCYLRQACYSTQPPFNSGIPSIFAPHSLTREINPFFLQSSLPCAAVLPSIQTLLQSEHANPFLDSIPPCLQSELGHMRFPQEWQNGYLNHLAADPNMGYGFVYGGNNHVAPPSNSRARKPSGDKGSSAQLPAPQLVASGSAAVTPHSSAQAFVSTPNIDRACEYLCNQQARNSNNRGGSPRGSSAGSSAARGAKPTARRAVATVTTEKPPAPPTSRVTRSQLAELFSTPLAQEVTPFTKRTQQHSQQHSQRSQHSADESGGTSYEWTGSSIGSLHHLGVDVLTPAALPQCTPMTVDVPQQPGGASCSQYPYQHSQGHSQQHQQYMPPMQYAQYQTPEPQENQYFMNPFLTDGFSELAQDDIFALCRDVDAIHPSPGNNHYNTAATSFLSTAGAMNSADDNAHSAMMDYSHYHSSVYPYAHSRTTATAHSNNHSNNHSSGTSKTQTQTQPQWSGYISTPSTEQESQRPRELVAAPLTQQAQRGEPHEAYLLAADSQLEGALGAAKLDAQYGAAAMQENGHV